MRCAHIIIPDIISTDFSLSLLLFFFYFFCPFCFLRLQIMYLFSCSLKPAESCLIYLVIFYMLSISRIPLLSGLSSLESLFLSLYIHIYGTCAFKCAWNRGICLSHNTDNITMHTIHT